MSAIEESRWPILLPDDTFTWSDPFTGLVHRGAVIVKPEGDQGRVIGWTRLCVDVLTPSWQKKPEQGPDVVTCLDCLGAQEQ